LFRSLSRNTKHSLFRYIQISVIIALKSVLNIRKKFDSIQILIEYSIMFTKSIQILIEYSIMFTERIALVEGASRAVVYPIYTLPNEMLQ